MGAHTNQNATVDNTAIVRVDNSQITNENYEHNYNGNHEINTVNDGVKVLGNYVDQRNYANLKGGVQCFNCLELVMLI